MAGSVKGIIVEIGGDTSKLQSALKKVNSSTSSLSKELKGINSLLKLDPKNTELVSQKQTVLKENIEQTSKKLEELKKTQEMADSTIANGGKISQENYRNLQREIINTENKLNSLKLESSKWTTAGRSIEEFGNKISNISSKMDAVGTTFTTRLTLPVTALATAAITTASSFESSMTKVAATMGITADEIKKGSESYKILEEAAKKSGETTKYSASEAADALNYLALAGYDAKKSAEVLPKVLNLAAAGDLELATASDMVTDAMAALNMETKDLDKYINEMAKTSQKSNTSVAQLGEATLTCAGTVNLAGMSLETMNAELGILANNGIKGAEGGTHLRNIILSLTSPTDVAAKSLKKLGINVKDSSGNVRDLNDIMKDFDKKLDGLSEEKKINIISTIFNKTDISAVNSLIKGSGKEFSKLKKEISNCDNAAQDMADTMNSSLKGQATLVKSQMESIAITIGQKLMPTVKKIVEQISNLATGFSKLSDEEVENIIKIGALVAAIGPATKILGTLGNTVGTVSKGIGTFSQAIGVMKSGATSGVASVDGLAKVLTGLTSPAGFATLAIGSLIAAYTAHHIAVTEEKASLEGLREEVDNQKKSWNELKETRNNALSDSLTEIDTTQKLAEELKEITNENGKVKQGYENRAKVILNQLNKALDTEYELNGNIIGQYDELKNNIDELIIKKKAEAVLNAYSAEYGNAVHEQAKASETLVGLKKQLIEASEKIATGNEKERKEAEILYSSIAKKIGEQQQIISEYGYTIQNYEKLQTASVSNNAEEIKKATEQMGMSYERAKETSKQSITEQINNQAKYLSILKSSLTEAEQVNDSYQANVLQTQIDTEKKKLSNLVDSLVEQTSTIEKSSPEQIQAWKNVAEQSFEEYKKGLSQLPKETQNDIQEATGIIATDTSLLTEAGEKGKQTTMLFRNNLTLADKTKEELGDTAQTINDDKSVNDATKELAKKADSGFNNSVNPSEWGSDLTQQLSSSMISQKAKTKVTNAASTVAGWISNFLHFSLPEKGPLSDMDKSMPDMINLMSKGIINNKSTLIKSAEKMAKDLDNALINNIKMPQVQDFGKLQGKLNSQILKSTSNTNNITVQFYPQKMTDSEMDRAFNYIDRKYGQYI